MKQQKTIIYVFIIIILMIVLTKTKFEFKMTSTQSIVGDPNLVIFRTLYPTISNLDNEDGIAFTINCGDTLTTAGEYTSTGEAISGTCNDILPTRGLGFEKVFDITSGITSLIRGSYTATANFALWHNLGNTEEYIIAGESSNKCIWGGFRTNIASTISTSPNSEDTNKEMGCTGCTPSCGEYGICIDNVQTRTCTNLDCTTYEDSIGCGCETLKQQAINDIINWASCQR